VLFRSDYNWGTGEQDKGKPVFAIGSGIVDYIEKWDGVTKGFGNHVFIKHIVDFDYELGEIKLKRGDVIYSHYCHLDSINVQKGQEVNIGDKIGTCGGSGGWPSHLHLEIRLPIGLGYNFWPKGYTYDWITQHYLDPYQFIEDNQVMPSDIYKELDLNNKESMEAAIDIWHEVMREGKWIKKDDCNKNLEEVKKAYENKFNKDKQGVIDETLIKAKADWKVSELQEKVKRIDEVDSIRKTVAFKIAIALAEILKNIEDQKRG
jgi:hypothetical protein